MVHLEYNVWSRLYTSWVLQVPENSCDVHQKNLPIQAQFSDLVLCPGIVVFTTIEVFGMISCKHDTFQIPPLEHDELRRGTKINLLQSLVETGAEITSIRMVGGAFAPLPFQFRTKNIAPKGCTKNVKHQKYHFPSMQALGAPGPEPHPSFSWYSHQGLQQKKHIFSWGGVGRDGWKYYWRIWHPAPVERAPKISSAKTSSQRLPPRKLTWQRKINRFEDVYFSLRNLEISHCHVACYSFQGMF